MEHTVKLFYEDTAVKEFDAAVLSCGPVKDGYEAVLDRTAFFPEAGAWEACLGHPVRADAAAQCGAYCIRNYPQTVWI